MEREELALWLLNQFLREPYDHCQEERDLLPPPPRRPLIYQGRGSHPGSWPRDKPFPTELWIVSSRVILVLLGVSVLAFGSGSGSGYDSVQDPGSPESCWSLWKSCCQQWNRCWCPGPETGSLVGCKEARPLHLGKGPAGTPGAPPAPFFSPRCAPVPRRTCCLLLSALRPSLSLPLVVARVVGANPQDCAPAYREQPWVSSGFEHGVLEVEESSPQASAGFSLGHCWLC